MKRTILLSLAGVLSAGALIFSQVAAADPDAASTSSATQGSSIAKGSPPPENPNQFCESDRFGDSRDRFHRPGRFWGGHRGHGVEKLDRLLNLTSEQKEKVKEIMEASQPKIRAIREEQRAKVQAVMDDARKQIRPLLTPAQQKVFDDAQKLREDARKLKEEAKNLRHEKKSDQSE
jgi:Spy/CpxP family protein refolding chaperone